MPHLWPTESVKVDPWLLQRCAELDSVRPCRINGLQDNRVRLDLRKGSKSLNLAPAMNRAQTRSSDELLLDLLVTSVGNISAVRKKATVLG
jgi:hypothetical protein